MPSLFQSRRTSLQRIYEAFADPYNQKLQRKLKGLWDELPSSAQTDKQLLGTQTMGCGATYNIMERCNFNCTSCYLADDANATPPLPFEEVEKQLKALRGYLGRGGNVQLTSGEVTLLPKEDLARIVRCANENELSPMVMTNGQVFLEQPGYLDYLVTEGGLEKVCIHIDITERGRRGMKSRDTERDIEWIRNCFAHLLRDVRKHTGKQLNASQSVTVTDKNLHDVPYIVQWMVNNSDAFRMLSLQPVAQVGRTKGDDGDLNAIDLLWSKFEEGLGFKLNREAFRFGHRQCNAIALLFVVQMGKERKVIELLQTEEDLASYQWLLDRVRLDTNRFPFDSTFMENLAYAFSLLARHPGLLWEAPAFVRRRLWRERGWFPKLMKAALTGKEISINPLVLVIHNFMSSHELDTPVGQERLASCSFRLPVDGEMVQMCRMNGTMMRDALNDQLKERATTHTHKQPTIRAA